MFDKSLLPANTYICHYGLIAQIYFKINTKAWFHIKLRTQISIRSTKILHCTFWWNKLQTY